MKLFTAEQIRVWDDYTIEHEPVSSIDLMERAATRCFEWVQANFPEKQQFVVFCGMGNNGGDGLVIARLLHGVGKQLTVIVLKTTDKGSPDFEVNLKRLKEAGVTIVELTDAKKIPVIHKEAILIDALFGTGLKRPLEGLAAQLINHINTLSNTKISVDVPSGLPADWVENITDYKEIIRTDYTVIFQVPKLSFLFPETGKYMGELVVADIGLSATYEQQTNSNYYWIDKELIASIYKKRNRFSHKGTYGHALLIGGAMGKAGAIVMAAQACVKAGAGLVTAFAPRSCNIPLQTVVPEAMAETIQQEEVLDFMPPNTDKYNAIGVGPGMGTQIITRDAFDDFLAQAEGEKLVLDADALNCLSANFAERKKIKLLAGAILTPHPKEFDRMFGDSKTSTERLQKQTEAAQKHKVTIVLKGTHTSVALPTGEIYFNSTGNPGMATGGSGDVLTGIITALRAQGYSQKEACLLGVYVHGLAADKALETESVESLSATDIISCLGKAFRDCLAEKV